jgi:hypothetical protein
MSDSSDVSCSLCSSSHYLPLYALVSRVSHLDSSICVLDQGGSPDNRTRSAAFFQKTLCARFCYLGAYVLVSVSLNIDWEQSSVNISLHIDWEKSGVRCISKCYQIAVSKLVHFKPLPDCFSYKQSPVISLPLYKFPSAIFSNL